MSHLVPIGLCLAALWTLPALGQVQGTSSSPLLGPDRLQVPQVADLRHGEALFLQFRGDDLEAATRLAAAMDSGLAPEHRAEAELLLGGLYLELGMHVEADRRLRGVLGEDVPPGVRNRAWFYLAKAWYLAGDLAGAEATVRRLAGVLPPELEAQRVHLLANLLTRQGRFAEAADLLDGWQGPPDWAAYSRFNLGVALIRDHQLDVAAHYLRAVTRGRDGSPELAALADMAGVTLGAAYLQGGDPELARPVLAGVRLEGPHSSRALLLAGWAASMAGDHEAALAPWMELRRRDPADPAVQEALLAIPHAYAQLGAPAQAVTEYEGALAVLGQQRAATVAALERARSGALADEMLSAALEDGGRGWGWEFPAGPPAGPLRLLGELPASHALHERLRDQRDLAYLERRLEAWGEELDTLLEWLVGRNRDLAQARDKVQASLAAGRSASLGVRLDEASRRVDAASATADPLAVAPVDVQQRWNRVIGLEQALAGSSASPAARERARLLRGVLLWDALDAQAGNLRARGLEVADAQALVREAREREARLDVALAAAGPGGDAGRLESAKARLGSVLSSLRLARAEARDELGAIMAGELQQRLRRIDDYEVQVRFAMAVLYDRASTPDASAAPQGAPVGAPASPGATP